MYRARTDLKKNRLYLTITEPNRKTLIKALKEVEQLCLALKPNFTCLTDLRNCEIISESDQDIIEKAQNRMWGLGLGKAVRIISDTNTDKSLVDILRAISAEYPIAYVKSVQDAEEILDSYKRGLDSDRGLTEKEKYKIIDRYGWEDENRYLTYEEAIKDLKQIRRSGHETAIIVDARVFIHNNSNKP